MKISRVVWVAMVALGVAGCVVDKQLGDDADGGADGGAEGGASSSTSDDGNDGPGNSESDSGQPSTDDGEPGPGTSTGPEPSDDSDTGEPQMCSEFIPPPFNCDLPGDATALCMAEEVPDATAQPCTIDSIVNVDATTDTVTLACDQTFSVDITTEAPHVPLPLSVGQAVTLDTRPFDDEGLGVFNDTVSRSFTLHSDTGDLLLAWINMVEEQGESLDVGLPIAPLAYGVSLSGCATNNVAEKCKAGGEITSQRSGVDYEGNLYFDGNSVGISSIDQQWTMTIQRAERIVCWDDDCIGDDSGPFDTLRLLIIATSA